MSIEHQSNSTIRILVASDNHIGFAERNPIRGNDSFNAFDEIMSIAEREQVDLVLLGGDLFHENKPSRLSMYQVFRSIRMHCLGDKPCELQVLSDQSLCMGDTATCHINCEDPNINISIPIFSIHGNHDDPSGESRLSSLDVLQVAGMINYFGKIAENDDIEVQPILLQKMETKLALFGMSNCRDERLYRSFRNGKVKFMRPQLYEDEWFNICVVHQNRTPHSSTGYLPENFLPDFLDFVVWGHEHECKISPTLNTDQGFFVMQPGSSIATSLCQAEAAEKCVALLSIYRKSFSTNIIPLRSVRPFAVRDVILSESAVLKRLAYKENHQAVAKYLIEQAENLITVLKKRWLEKNLDEQFKLPLIRLRVDYSGGYQVLNPQRLSQWLSGKVANATDVFQFHQKIARTKGEKNSANKDYNEFSKINFKNMSVDELINQFLNKQELNCLPEKRLGEAVFQFVEKDDREAVKGFLKSFLKEQVNFMVESKIHENDIDKEFEKIKIKNQLKRKTTPEESKPEALNEIPQKISDRQTKKAIRDYTPAPVFSYDSEGIQNYNGLSKKQKINNFDDKLDVPNYTGNKPREPDSRRKIIADNEIN